MEDTSRSGDPVDFFSDLVRCETRLYNLLDEQLRREHGIVTSQYEFLRFVRDHDGARVADLALEFAVGIGATSKAVDRLEARGLLERRPNPADRRSMVLALTTEGAELLDHAERLVRTRLEALLPQRGRSFETAGAVLRGLRSSLEEQRLGMPAG